MVSLPASFVWGLVALAIVSTLGLGSAVIQLRCSKVSESDCRGTRTKIYEKLDEVNEKLTRLETQMERVLSCLNGDKDS